MLIKRIIMGGLVISLLSAGTAFADYDQSTNVYKLDYKTAGDTGYEINVLCMKPKSTTATYTPAEITTVNIGDAVEYSEFLTATPENGATTSFSVKEGSPEGNYDIYILTEKMSASEKATPYASFYYLGSGGLTTMLGGFNTATDFEALLTEYSSASKKVLDITVDQYYQTNKTAINQSIEAERATKTDGEFKTPEEIAAAYKNAVTLHKLNNITDAAKVSVVEELIALKGYTKSEFYTSKETEIINAFAAKGAVYNNIDEAYKSFTDIVLLTIVNSQKDQEEMKKIVTHFAAELGVDITAYNNCNIYGANAYIIEKNFTSVDDLKAAINKGITESPKTTTGGTGGSGGSSGGGSGNSGGGSGSSGSSSGGGVIVGGFVNPTLNAPVFSDLPESHWAYTAISELSKKGVVSGDGNKNFRPDNSITREEFIKMLVEAFDFNVGMSSATVFGDVDQNAWYAPYVAAAYSNGITSGQTATTFGIGEKITRQDMAVFIKRAVDCKGKSFKNITESGSFADDSAISPYAYDAVMLLKNAGIISGMGDNRYEPFGTSTRAQAAVIIYRAMLNI